MGSDFFVFLTGCFTFGCLGLEGGARGFLRGVAGSLLVGGLSPSDGDWEGVLWSSSLAPLGFYGDGYDDQGGCDGPVGDDGPRGGCAGDDGLKF
uniref:Secreted protein n=1 Tax=Setaria viridis TaxID=4556 RepID=A0A4U6U9B1_SETVI|nr:hypothetical protein SEVIR_6G101157v2 [Setaria viridis]